MAKIRVHELAKELGISSKQLMSELGKAGITVKSILSAIDQEDAQIFKSIYKENKTQEVKKEKKKAPKEVKAKEKAIGKIEPKKEIDLSRKPKITEKKSKKIITKPEIGELEKIEGIEPVEKIKKPRKAPVKAKIIPLPVKIELPPPKEIKKEIIKLSESVTVNELAEKMKKKASDIIKSLMEMGIIATINELLDTKIAKLVAQKFGFEAEIFSLEGEEIIEEKIDSSQLKKRAPVVTVMGHVDHGKTSLLDAIRKTNVTQSEFGGITQHIGAYKVETEHGNVVFLDTPGHEAFTAMRARGTQVTDIVVLVVAADDGVMPQTIEAINHAKAANVPIIVAINKIDKPGSDSERVKRDLSNLGLIPEEWGGQTIYVETSAKKRIGIENLLEMILIQSEIMELKANPSRAAKGIVIESRLEKGRGPVATVLIQNGSLKESDIIIAGCHYGRVRAMFNDKGKKVKAANPSDPVELLGLSGTPVAGDTMLVLDEERKARQIALMRLEKERRKMQAEIRKVTLEDLHKQIKEGVVKELKIILKADTHGSVEALSDVLEKQSTEEVRLKVIHASVGAITETDVMLASASNAIIIGFNVKLGPNVNQQAKEEGVDIRNYSVIYDAISDIRSALQGMLAPEIREIYQGRAQVKEIFNIPKIGLIAGCTVNDGKIVRNAKAKLIRDGNIIKESNITSLKRFKDDVKEVLSGYECGVGLQDVNDIAAGDIIETFTTEEVQRIL